MLKVLTLFVVLLALGACAGSDSGSGSEPNSSTPSPETTPAPTPEPTPEPNPNPEPEPNPEPPAQTSNQDEQGWVQVQVDAKGPYGEQSFDLPAAQNWANTGLYLRTGQSAKISATGTWQVVTIGFEHGPEGLDGSDERGCKIGQLVARIGLYYDDADLSCIGEQGSITAHRDGIVFVGGLVSNDLGETYESRRDASGKLRVTVQSQGNTVPTITRDLVNYFNYEQVNSGWVELRSEHTIITLPTATAIQDKNKLAAVLQRFDAIYQSHKNLRAAVPHHGQPIRWFPDSSAPGWMLAGNPVRMDLSLVDAQSNDRITLAAEPGNGDWGFAHELGHDFNFINGDWQYAHTTAGIEAWPNIFSVYVQEQLNLPLRDLDCANKKAFYLASGNFNDLQSDIWLSLCFLLEFKDQYGWDFYKRFHAELNQSAFTGWDALHTRFENAAGENVRTTFETWKIPLLPEPSENGEPEERSQSHHRSSAFASEPWPDIPPHIHH